jgi:peptidyl-prolyl cis-trans isomerase SurA
MKKRNFKRINKEVVCSMIYVLTLLILTSFLTGAAESRQVVDRVVAVVNEDVILLSDLDEAIKPYLYKLQDYGYSHEEKEKLFFKLREDVLHQLINERLTDQQVKKSGIEVSEKEIDEAIEKMKQANRLTDERLRSALASEGMTIDDLKEKLREQILRSKLVSYEVKSKIVVTEEDIEACYIRENEKYCETKKYHLRSILMRTPPGGDQQATEEKMLSVHEKLRNGEDFEELARMYSHPSLARSGGYLGAFEQETLAPKIREAISNLKAGEFTPVLDTDQGFQIFYVDRVDVERGKSLEEATAEIEEQLYKEIVDQRFSSWLDELRKKSHIKIIR